MGVYNNIINNLIINVVLLFSPTSFTEKFT